MTESEARTEAPRNFRALLLVACVFAMVGGFTDAYSFLAYDGVFANAQTGNVVLFAVSISGRNWHEAMRYVPPIGAFALGVAVAEGLSFRDAKRAFGATVLCQGIEGVVLILVALAGGGLGRNWVVPLLSFCSALQHTSFDAIGPWKFNTAMTTGNLRSGVSGLVKWLAGKEPVHNRKSVVVSFSVMACFAMGGLAGSFATRGLGTRSLLICVGLVGLGMGLTVLGRARAGLRTA